MAAVATITRTTIMAVTTVRRQRYGGNDTTATMMAVTTIIAASSLIRTTSPVVEEKSQGGKRFLIIARRLLSSRDVFYRTEERLSNRRKKRLSNRRKNVSPIDGRTILHVVCRSSTGVRSSTRRKNVHLSTVALSFIVFPLHGRTTSLPPSHVLGDGQV